ncbi:putative KN motif and ankyrin repeat domain-containing protein [Fasciolopsis buskii]|uniref:Putative KN motif and ankyrin repeat domain-containing protein n=1 Tax=Fasciolopsis buskii TaxID=27845 RepID=A0A8E0S1G1_9TREM|nr:putative KN motif and ankyrin repeat domain-containing protein [Fasciolopsis buski]
MSAPYGPGTALFIQPGQSELHHPAAFAEPYSNSRMLQSPGHEPCFSWEPVTQQYSPVDLSTMSFQRASVGPIINGSPHFFPVSDSEEDKDEFVTFGTCTSLRGERSAYDPMHSNYAQTTSINGAMTDIDDVSHVPTSAGLDVDEACDEMKAMPDGLSVVDSDYIRLARENELLRQENLRLHELNETFEKKQYAQNSETLVLDESSAGLLDDDDQIEEIIEEEIHTIKHARPPTIVAPTRQELTSEYIESQDEAIQSMSPERKNVGIGNWSSSQHHLIDLSAPVIDESQFPASYWARLEELFYSRFGSSRPITRELGVQTREATHRTAATMAVPLQLTPKERHCFGVSVSPVMQSVGVMCPRVSTREFGCTTLESGVAVRDWIDNRLVGMSDTTRKLVHRLFKSSLRSREEFLDTILHVVKRDLRHVGLQIKPEQRSQFAYTRSERMVSTASGGDVPLDLTDKRETESKMVEARPTLSHRSVLTYHIAGTSVACETETPLLRSQGAQAVPDAPDVTACSVQVGQQLQTVDQALDPISYYTRHVTTGIQVGSEATETDVILSESEVERLWHSSKHRSQSFQKQAGHQSDTLVETSSTTSTQQQQQQQQQQPQSTVESTFSSVSMGGVHPQTPARVVHTEVPHEQSSTQSPQKSNFTPTKVQRTEKVVTESNFTRSPQSSTAGDDLRHLSSGSLRQSAPYWTNASGSSESYTVSTERRMIDELSQRHLLPSDVDLEALSRGDQEALDAAIARAKDLGTTHVVREFQPEVEVVHHLDGALESQSPFIPTTPESAFTPAVHPGAKSFKVSSTGEEDGFHIPVIHSSLATNSPNSQVRAIPVERVQSSSTRLPATTRLEAVPPRKRATTRSDLRPSTSDESDEIVPQINRPSSRMVSYRPNEKQSIMETHVDEAQTEKCILSKRVDTETQLRKSHPANLIPHRNHSFVMPADVEIACQFLTEHYKKQTVAQSWSSTRNEFEKLRTTWFDLTGATKLELEKLEDFVAILYEHHEDLLRDVMQSVDDNGSTSLHYAVGHGAWPVVNLILDSGYAEPDRFNLVGFSPIMIATVCNVSDSSALTTLNRLFQAGNVNLRSNTSTRQTPLMMAASNASRDVVALLLEHGAQVNMQDTSGNTALMFALESGDLSVISLLLDCPDLDLTLRDNDGQDALSIAKSKENYVAVNMIERVWVGFPNEFTEKRTTTTTTTTTVSKYVVWKEFPIFVFIDYIFYLHVLSSQ